MRRPSAPRRQPPQTGRLLLLAALTLVVLPQLTHMPLWLAAGCMAVLAWRLLRDVKGWSLPGGLLRLAITILGTVAILSHYHTLIGRDAGSALLTVMLCLKLLELRILRDAMVALFLGYFLVVTGFLFSQSIFMGLYLFAVVLALTTALIALNHPGASTARIRSYARTAGGLLLQSLPLMVLLFVLFPRIPGPLWSLPDQGSSARTGLSEEMTLGTITDLVESEEVAFRVQFDGAVPDADLLYWRGPVLWHTDGRRWSPLGNRVVDRLKSGQVSYQGVEPTVAYTLTMEPHDRKWLFALDLPARVPSLPGGAWMRPDYQLVAENKVTDVQRYRLESYTRYNTGPLPDALRHLALHLPGDNSNPATRQLARQWHNAGLTPQAIIRHALDYFRDNAFYYSRRPPPLPGRDPVDRFLFDTRRGFCEHYAASFVTLMRAAGLPSRVVTGYQGGEVNPLGNYLIVRQSDAHAWAEVWLTGQGWVRIDPTAVIPAERVETPLDLVRFSSTAAFGLDPNRTTWLARNWQRLKNGWDAVNYGWNQWVLGFNEARQAALLERLGLARFGWAALAGLLVVSLIGAVLLLALYLIRHKPPAPDPVARLYQHFCRKLARQGIARMPSEGPLTFANRASGLRPDLAGAIGSITRLYIGLRYGGRNPAGYHRLKQHVSQFRP